MFKPRKLCFGPAGIPRSTKKKGTPNGVLRVAELGLDAMEMEFVRGVRLSEGIADETRKASEENGVLLTVHAPYYINLLSADGMKVKASVGRILDSARVGSMAGAWSVIFHPGYYGKLDGKEAVRRIRESMEEIVSTLRDEGVEVWIRPETMGGLSEFGSLDEVLEVVEGLDMALPGLDFAHLYARSLGEFNGLDRFRWALERIEGRLGREALLNMHVHISGMEYGPRGEKKHLPLEESEFRWRDAVKALKEFNVRGAVINESPTQEDDALLLKEEYSRI